MRARGGERERERERETERKKLTDRVEKEGRFG